MDFYLLKKLELTSNFSTLIKAYFITDKLSVGFCDDAACYELSTTHLSYVFSNIDNSIM